MKAVLRTENPSLSNIASVADPSPPGGVAGLPAPALGAVSAGFDGSPPSVFAPAAALLPGFAAGEGSGEAEGVAGGWTPRTGPCALPAPKLRLVAGAMT